MKKSKSLSGRIRARAKVWLETDEGYVLGEGRIKLLRGIEEHGSLHRAAAAMGMSYRAAWGSLRSMEKRLGFPLVEVIRGGPGGGGMMLTPDARALLRRFDAFTRSVHKTMDRRFSQLFYPKENASH